MEPIFFLILGVAAVAVAYHVYRLYSDARNPNIDPRSGSSSGGRRKGSINKRRY